MTPEYIERINTMTINPLRPSKIRPKLRPKPQGFHIQALLPADPEETDRDWSAPAGAAEQAERLNALYRARGIEGVRFEVRSVSPSHFSVRQTQGPPVMNVYFGPLDEAGWK